MNKEKDYRVSIKVRNARIIKALEEKGEVVGAIAAKRIGISYAKLLALSNLKLSPIDKQGNVTPEVTKLCEFTNKMPVELFSPDQIMPFETNTAEVDMSMEEVEVLMLPAENADPEKLLMQAQTTNVLFNLLDSLTPREKEILFLRNGIDCQAHTYAEIGKMYGVTQERIRQLEAKALRKMRHPSRFHHLRTVLPQLDMIKEQAPPVPKEENDEYAI